jgi:hypothetical protein
MIETFWLVSMLVRIFGLWLGSFINWQKVRNLERERDEWKRIALRLPPEPEPYTGKTQPLEVRR